MTLDISVWREPFGAALALNLLACANTGARSSEATGGTGGLASAMQSPGTSTAGSREPGTGSLRDSFAAVGKRASPFAVQNSEDWLTRDSEWDVSSDTDGCRIRSARRPGSLWPGLPWAGCGPGCRSAPVLPGTSAAVAARLGIASRNSGGDLLLSTSAGVVGGKQEVLGTFAYGSGQPLSLISAQGETCLAQFAGRRSPFLVSVSYFDSALNLYGWLDPLQRPNVSWLNPRTTLSLASSFDFGTGWGGVFNFASIALTRDPLSTTLHDVYASKDLIRTPVGAEGVLFWTEGGVGHGKIMALSPEDRAVTLASGDWYPTNVGVSAERIVWLGAQGERVVDGSFDSARIYQCKRSSVLAPCEPEPGPFIPIVSMGRTLEVRDHWAGITGCTDTVCDAYIVDLDSSRVYHPRRPQGVLEMEVLGFSSSEFFIGGGSAQTHGSSDYDSFLRFELSLLPEYSDTI